MDRQTEERKEREKRKGGRKEVVYGNSAVKTLVTLVLEDLSSVASTHIREYTTNWELHLWDPVASSDLHRYPHV